VLPPPDSAAQRTLGLQTSLLDGGHTRAVLPVRHELCLADATAPAALFAVVADRALSQACHEASGGTRQPVTRSMVVDVLGSERAREGCELIAEGGLATVVGTDAHVRANVRDDAGQDLAQASAWFYLAARGHRAGGAGGAGGASGADGAGESAPPARAAPTAPALPALGPRHDPAASPLAALFGLTLTEISAESVRGELRHPEPLVNVTGSLHGGMAVVFAELVADAALASAGAPSDLEPRHLATYFLRPAGVGGAIAPCVAKVVRVTRTSAFVESTVLDARDDVAARVHLAYAVPER
jgi:uncharacterized protein (TIGR00369 family)